MSIITSVIFTVIGGLVAGGVGYFATIVSLREQRKQKHLEEHKNNLNAVSKALDQIWGEVWPFVFGAEDLKLPKSPFGNEESVQNIQIKTVPIIMQRSILSSGNNRTFQVGIDSVLYDDIKAHFPELNKLLEKTEQKLKENSSNTLKLLNYVSDIIYEGLTNTDIDFPGILIHNENGLNPTTTKFINLSDEDKMINAGYIFLMVIGDDEDTWPNKVRLLKRNNVYYKLKKLSEEIEIQFREDLERLRELHNQILQLIDETKDEIDKIEHMTSLKGRCRYL